MEIKREDMKIDMEKIYGGILEIIKKFPKSIFIWILVGIVLLCVIVGKKLPLFIGDINYYDYFGTPGFDFKEEGKSDRITSDMELGDSGEATVSMYAVVKHNGEILCIVAIVNYYNKNYAYINDVEGSEFVLEVDDTQREKMEDLTENLKKLLNEGGALQDSFEVDIVHLAHINYQNAKNGYYDKASWYFTKGVAREISEYEVDFWRTKYFIDLDEYEVNGFAADNQQLMDVVNSCKGFISE